MAFLLKNKTKKEEEEKRQHIQTPFGQVLRSRSMFGVCDGGGVFSAILIFLYIVLWSLRWNNNLHCAFIDKRETFSNCT